jgi:hypothetical protein
MIPIHVALVHQKNHLLLRKTEDGHFQWFQVSFSLEREEKTPIGGASAIAAITAGYKAWVENFRLIHCGFRYTLPERDEVGSNALFWQMALSYNSPNGRYFDEEVGHLCYVDFASQEALEIWRKIRVAKPLGNTRA